MLLSLVSVAYALMLAAFVARDVLRLRSLLVVSQALIAFYAWRSGVAVISLWNLVFVLVNATMAVQIVRERRAVALPRDLQRLYERHFAALTPAEFLRWWRQGRRETIVDQPLARAGERPEWLYFLIDGRARVTRNEANVLELPAGFFVAEMSLITGAPATADVDAIGTVEVMRWPTPELDELRQRQPILWTKIQSVIGRDLVAKIQRGERRPPEVA
jgi:CRP-like cAMP-binding protein